MYFIRNIIALVEVIRISYINASISPLFYTFNYLKHKIAKPLS